MPIEPTPLAHDSQSTERSVWTAMAHGMRQVCPCCGRGALYRAYLKIIDTCAACGEELSHQRADDAPAYFTMVIVGHIVVPGALAIERTWAPDPWIQFAVWAPLTVIMSLLLLPRVKGALVGLQWALRMHGFGGSGGDDNDPR